MSLTVLYFASLKEGLGTARESLERPTGVSNAGELRAWLGARGGRWAELLAPQRTVRMAVDQRMAGPDTPIGPDAEVAFFPPVTGG